MRVFINPGHSENCKPDPGATSGNNKEALIARQISDELANILKDNNFDVILYQQRNEKGEDLTANQQLNRVPGKANLAKADIFVSIHLNASTSSLAKGTETLYAKNSAKGEKLANLVQSKLAEHFVNRGAKVDVRNLWVLRATQMPSILIEVGFISNPVEIEYIKTNIRVIAMKIAQGICQYFDVNMDQIVTQKQKCKNKIILEENEDGSYNCYVNDIIKLKANKLKTCLGWIDKNV